MNYEQTKCLIIYESNCITIVAKGLINTVVKFLKPLENLFRICGPRLVCKYLYTRKCACLTV